MPQFLFVHNVIVSVFSAPLPLLSYSKTTIQSYYYTTAQNVSTIYSLLIYMVLLLCISVADRGFFRILFFSSQIQGPATTKRGGKTIACFTVFAALSSPTKLIII
jgi:hypothetical protein